MQHLHFPKATKELCDVPRKDRRSAPAAQRRGVGVLTPLEGGPVQEMDLCQCCHCQTIFVYVRGSGNIRGSCMRCGTNGIAAITCGAPECDVCVPAEQLIENMGAGMPFHEARAYRPIKASVPRSPGGILLGKG